MSLTEKHCVPCEGNVPPLTKPEIETLQKELTLKWIVEHDKVIQHLFTFRNFVEAIAFVDKIALVAEAEGHHPDITINYNKVTIALQTHAIKGLSDNDFILAANIEKIGSYIN